MGNMKMMMAVVMAVMAMAIRATMGGVFYRVGDSAGWTNIGHVDYKTWASTKRFHIGDNIVFTYNKDFQNVVRVPYTGYLTCNGATSYDTYSSGNDTFSIEFPGHYYFICTLPGHCEAGQKVDIRVPLAADYSYPPPPPPSDNTAGPIQPLPFPYPPPPAASPSPVRSSPSQTPPPALVDGSSSSPPAVATRRVAPAPTPEKSAGQPTVNFKFWTTVVMAALFYLIAF